MDLDQDALQARREQAEAKRAEADKRERRKVLTLNKLGDAAMGVRRDFLKKLLARKTPPTGAAIFVATCLSSDAYLLTHHKALDTTAELLGIERAAVANQAAELGANGDNRAQVITLALVLGALEARLCGVSGSVHCSDVLPLRISQRQGCRYRGMPARRWFGSARAI